MTNIDNPVEQDIQFGTFSNTVEWFPTENQLLMNTFEDNMQHLILYDTEAQTPETLLSHSDIANFDISNTTNHIAYLGRCNHQLEVSVCVVDAMQGTNTTYVDIPEDSSIAGFFQWGNSVDWLFYANHQGIVPLFDIYLVDVSEGKASKITSCPADSSCFGWLPESYD